MSLRTPMGSFTSFGDGDIDIDWGSPAEPATPASNVFASPVKTASKTLTPFAFTKSLVSGPSGASLFRPRQTASTQPSHTGYAVLLAKRMPPMPARSSTENKMAPAKSVSVSAKPSEQQHSDARYFLDGFTGFESMYFPQRTETDAKASPAVAASARTTREYSFYLPEWFEPTLMAPAPLAVAQPEIPSENKAVTTPTSPTSKPRTLAQPDAAQVLARTILVAPVSATFTPLERTMRKLMGERAKGNQAAFMPCLTQVMQEHPMKGYFSKMSSNFVKSGALFGIQYAVGGYPGFFLGGLFQGMGTSAQQVLDHKLAKNHNAHSYLELIRQSELKPLLRDMSKPCAIGAIQGGAFWYLFTSQAAQAEQFTKDWLKRNGLENTPVSELAPFFARFGVAVGVGYVTYPSHRLTQVFIRHPELCITDVVLGDAKPTTVKEVVPLVASATKRAYCSVVPGLTVFGITRAAVLTAALAADKLVDCARDPGSADCAVSKKPAKP